MLEWFQSHGRNINALQHTWTWTIWKTIEWSKLLLLDSDNKRTWISPTTSQGRKMTHYKALDLHSSSDEWECQIVYHWVLHRESPMILSNMSRVAHSQELHTPHSLLGHSDVCLTVLCIQTILTFLVNGNCVFCVFCDVPIVLNLHKNHWMGSF